MRTLFFIIALSSTTHVSLAQFEFEMDSTYKPILAEQLKGSKLGNPNFDSLKFDFRFWAWGEFGGFVQLTYDYQNNWKYRTGYLTENFEIIDLNPVQQPNIDSLWISLRSNDILTLPQQDSLHYLMITSDGRTQIITLEEQQGAFKESFIRKTLEGDSYSIELRSSNNYRQVYYYNPVKISESLLKSGRVTSPETDKFAAIVNILTDYFMMNEIYKHNIKARAGD